MMHPDTRLEWISDKKGFGVVATKPIPKGTITWVQDELDGVYPADTLNDLKPLTREHFEKYSFRNNNGEFILCWDIAKYVNHSFRSNCLSTAYNFEVAVRDIQIGEELTDDYGYLNLTEAFVPEDEGAERKIVEPDDTLKCYEKWDKILSGLFPLIKDRSQPLMELLSAEIRREINDVAKGEKEMLSTLNLYYEPQKSEFNG